MAETYLTNSLISILGSSLPLARLVGERIKEKALTRELITNYYMVLCYIHRLDVRYCSLLVLEEAKKSIQTYYPDWTPPPPTEIDTKLVLTTLLLILDGTQNILKKKAMRKYLVAKLDNSNTQELDLLLAMILQERAHKDSCGSVQFANKEHQKLWKEYSGS